MLDVHIHQAELSLTIEVGGEMKRKYLGFFRNVVSMLGLSVKEAGDQIHNRLGKSQFLDPTESP